MRTMDEGRLISIASKIGYTIINGLIAIPSDQRYLEDFKSIRIIYKLNKKWSEISAEIDADINADYTSILNQICCDRKNTLNCPKLNSFAIPIGCASCPAYDYDYKALKDRIISGIKKHLEDCIVKIRHRCFYRFYPVGQGLMCGIYTCRYQYKNVDIDMDISSNGFGSTYDIVDGHLTIYDCGSTISLNFPEDMGNIIFQMLKDDCERFKVCRETEKYVIDQMIVSHFDCDHINGINRLTEEHIIKNFIYPFSSKLDMISMFFKHLDALTEFEKLFAPKEYLISNLNAKNIIEVHSGNNLDHGTMPFIKDNTEIEGIAGSLIYDQIDEINNSKGPKFYTAYLPDGMSAEDSISATHKDEIWMQQLIFCLPSGKTYENVYETIKKEFIKIGINLETETPETIRTLIMGKLKTKEGHGEIAQIFRSLGYKADSDTNASSLCFYFGPRTPGNVLNDDYRIGAININGHWIKEIQKSLHQRGLLLTGDSVLDYAEGVLKMSHAQTLVNEMNESGARPGAILLPHHGSEHNISADSFNILHKGTDAKNWVVSFGINYKFGHPHNGPCVLFGCHILPVIQKEETGISDVEKRFKPMNENLVYVTVPGPQFPFGSRCINDVTLFHCNDQCCVLLECYSSL